MRSTFRREAEQKQGDMGAIAESNLLDETRQGTATRITDTYRDLYRRLSQGREGGTIDNRHVSNKVPRLRSPNNCAVPGAPCSMGNQVGPVADLVS